MKLHLDFGGSGGHQTTKDWCKLEEGIFIVTLITFNDVLVIKKRPPNFREKFQADMISDEL